MDFPVKQSSKIRILPSPEDGLRALVDHAPQAEAWVERLMDRLRPYLTWLYASRRRLATTAVVLLSGWLFVHVMFGANGMEVYRQKRTEYQDLQKQIDSLQRENDRYTTQIKSLQTDPATIEKEAREQFGYARKGEVVYVTPQPPPPQPPASATARK
jgi:cell division protein FtsB